MSDEEADCTTGCDACDGDGPDAGLRPAGVDRGWGVAFQDAVPHDGARICASNLAAAVRAVPISPVRNRLCTNASSTFVTPICFECTTGFACLAR
eukprot:634503-Prymnesium_polylepis.1